MGSYTPSTSAKSVWKTAHRSSRWYQSELAQRQSADLEAKDDTDVIKVHLGHDPLKTSASLGGSGCLGLVVVDDDDPRGRPTPSQREIAEAALNFSGLFVVNDLILARLANIDDSQPFEVPRLDLAWSARVCRYLPRAKLRAWRADGARSQSARGQLCS